MHRDHVVHWAKHVENRPFRVIHMDNVHFARVCSLAGIVQKCGLGHFDLGHKK